MRIPFPGQKPVRHDSVLLLGRGESGKRGYDIYFFWLHVSSLRERKQ